MKQGWWVVGLALALVTAGCGTTTSRAVGNGAGLRDISATTLPADTTSAPSTTTTTVPATTTTTTASVGAATSAISVDANGTDKVQPTTIGFSEDAGNIAKDLVWSGWGSTEAVAHGTVDEESCNPDCASGPVTPTPVTIALKDIQNGVYQEIAENIQGHTELDFSSTNLLPGNTPLQSFSETAYRDLQGTWVNSAMNFSLTVDPKVTTLGEPFLTTNLGGKGSPTATQVTFTNVQASSGALTFTYDLTNPNEVTVNLYDGGGPLFTAQRATVVVDIGNQDVVEPTTIALDGAVGPTAEDLEWTSWGSPTTVAHGTVDVEGSSPKPAEMELTNIEAGFYQQLVLLVQGWPPETYTAAQMNNAETG